jgi:hypothetical protein
VRTLLAREPGDLTVGQQHCIVRRSGPHREGEEPCPHNGRYWSRSGHR